MNCLALFLTFVFLGMMAPMTSAWEREAATKFEVGRNVRVSSKGGPFVEPYIAAHPEDAQSIIISASEAIRDKGIIAVSFFTSDGGGSWSTAALPQMQEALASGDLRHAVDNWVAYAPDGTAYYSTLASMKLQGKWRMPVLVYRSDDKGQSWQKPVVVAGSFDRPALVATGQKEKAQLFGVAYVSGRDSLVVKDPVDADAIAVMRSDDGARSFRTTAFIAHSNLGHNAMNPLVLADGSLLVPYADYPDNPKQQLRSSRIYVMRSQDGGRTSVCRTLWPTSRAPSRGFLNTRWTYRAVNTAVASTLPGTAAGRVIETSLSPIQQITAKAGHRRECCERRRLDRRTVQR